MHSSISSFLSRRLIDRAGGHRRAVLAAFAEKQRVAAVSPEERAIWQNRRLADLLNHARTTVPFWAAAIKQAVAPENARLVLAELPVMNRSAIQAEPSAFLSSASGALIDDATGGSSGTPMRFKVDRATQIARESSLYWSDSLAGWRYGDRIAMLWGSDKDVKTAGQEAKLAFRWWIDNRRWYNAFNMGEDRMAEFHAAMIRFRPHIIVAYAGSLEVYARFLEEHLFYKVCDKAHDKVGLPSLTYPLTALVSSAEMLTPVARERIERVFGRPVFDRYGNREFGAIAAEDGRGGLVVNPTDMVLESNEQGELLVTYLPNRGMPFIRYNTGDLTRLRPDGRLDPVAGRASDTIRTASGKLIHGEYFTHLMYRATRVREFQFVQEALDRYRLLVVADEPESASVIDTIRSDILEEVGRECALVVEQVDTIPVLPSGKRKFTVSHLDA
jgi:phenylacetate-CoA ligase